MSISPGSLTQKDDLGASLPPSHSLAGGLQPLLDTPGAPRPGGPLLLPPEGQIQAHSGRLHAKRASGFSPGPREHISLFLIIPDGIRWDCEAFIKD